MLIALPCLGANPELPLVGYVNTVVPTMGYRLPPYWNAPFEGKVDPFLIRNFDPQYNPYTLTGNAPCTCKPPYASNWNTEDPPPEGKRSLTRAQSTEQLCKKPFYMDVNSECNRDYRCAKEGPHVWDEEKRHYVCTDNAIRTFQYTQKKEQDIEQDISKMYCHS